MGAPLSRIIFGDTLPQAQRLRNIENHYQLEMIAENTAQIARFQADALMMQAAVAMDSNSRLASMAFKLDMMNGTLEDILDGVQQVSEDLCRLSSTLDNWLSTISQQIHSQQRTLDGIADSLLRPLEVPIQEIRRHADHALKNGMKSSQEDERLEWYRDAMHLLVSAIDNPVGKQDYVVWFQIGWLHWKTDGDLTEAEQAFSRAARLSAPTGDVYHIESLRHLAYIRYLREDPAGAKQAIAEALNVSSDACIVYDAARYAAATNQEAEAVSLLDRCIDLEPVTIIGMLVEPDFAGMLVDLERLARKRLGTAHANVQDTVNEWDASLTCVHECEQEAAYQIAVPGHLGRAVIKQTRDRLEDSDYLTTLDLGRQARQAIEETMGMAEEALQEELALRAEITTQAEARVQSALASATKTKEDAAKRKQKSIDSSRYEASSASRELGHELLWFIPYMIREGWLPALGITVAFAIVVGVCMSMIEDAGYPGLLDHMMPRVLLFSPVLGVGSVAAYRLLPRILRAARTSSANLASPSEAENGYVRTVEQADSELSKRLPELEKALRLARSRQEQVERALSLIRKTARSAS